MSEIKASRPAKPSWLSAAASEHWDRNVAHYPSLEPMDAEFFALWCELGAEITADVRNADAERIEQWRLMTRDLRA